MQWWYTFKVKLIFAEYLYLCMKQFLWGLEHKCLLFAALTAWNTSKIYIFLLFPVPANDYNHQVAFPGSAT